MTLYLVRHGEAAEGSDDHARPLTREGRREVKATARVARAAVGEVERILQSGRRRARETAEIWAETLEPSPPIEEHPGLDPMEDPADAAARIDAAGESLMLVGHLPHLSRVASLLVTGDPEGEVLVLPTGAVAALTQEKGGWRVRWLLTPKLARAVASRRKRE